ncbi:uncharacterized protein LOC119776916 isoform X3 [Cyprinodon tularosa]|uniref:uncharacterized protein LOC119776916 isoform X3 n=1 Tax=Cyprinodon tularosa TaxID=77115 RepID=UPI0018E258A4|nr:uncharacterized protein LOC119776916 isoform X3 [Cyprinodon tularosa]
MGCSPSKGKFLLKPNSFGKQEALVDESSQDSVDSGPAMVEDTCLNFQKKEKETPRYSDKNCSQETLMARQDSRPMFPQNTINNQEVRVNEMPQEIIADALQEHMIQRVEIQKKNMRRRSTDRHRKSSSIQTKADFLPHMVRAHQAAYGFLNPNITKYETLLGLLDQATQTKLSIQPIMAALVLYFEEINQALEEMAEEGELMLKEYGESMSLPSGMTRQPPEDSGGPDGFTYCSLQRQTSNYKTLTLNVCEHATIHLFVTSNSYFEGPFFSVYCFTLNVTSVKNFEVSET